MINVAPAIDYDELFFETASVVRMEAGRIVVRTAAHERVATRATMCLVEPEEGDRVMLGTSSDECYVLGVLARSSDRAARLGAEGDLEVHLPQGKFVVASKEGIELTTPGRTSLTTSRFHLRAVEGLIVLDRLRALGSEALCELGKLKVTARQVDSFAERVRERVKRAYRFVEEFDQLRAEHIDYRAKQTARVHADDAVITANRLAKVDGEQIHIG